MRLANDANGVRSFWCEGIFDAPIGGHRRASLTGMLTRNAAAQRHTGLGFAAPADPLPAVCPPACRTHPASLQEQEAIGGGGGYVYNAASHPQGGARTLVVRERTSLKSHERREMIPD